MCRLFFDHIEWHDDIDAQYVVDKSFLPKRGYIQGRQSGVSRCRN